MDLWLTKMVYQYLTRTSHPMLTKSWFTKHSGWKCSTTPGLATIAVSSPTGRREVESHTQWSAWAKTKASCPWLATKSSKGFRKTKTQKSSFRSSSACLKSTTSGCRTFFKKINRSDPRADSRSVRTKARSTCKVFLSTRSIPTRRYPIKWRKATPQGPSVRPR